MQRTSLSRGGSSAAVTTDTRGVLRSASLTGTGIFSIAVAAAAQGQGAAQAEPGHGRLGKLASGESLSVAPALDPASRAGEGAVANQLTGADRRLPAERLQPP